MTIAENLTWLRGRIAAAAERSGRDPAGVRLVGVTKGGLPGAAEARAVAAAVEAGLRDLGENIVQGAERRRGEVAAAAPVCWHFIGHLQTNKAKAAIEAFDIIQSVDSLRLAEVLDRRSALAQTRPGEPASLRLPVLLEVNVGREPSKFGFAPDAVAAAVSAVGRLPNLELRGLMTVAPAGSGAAAAVRPCFQSLRKLAAANGLTELSMGMTDDFEVAVEEGATIVRIGRALFDGRER